MSVARGHPKAAAGSYKTTMSQLEFDEEEYHKGLGLPNVTFVAQTLEQLILVSHDADEMVE